jgi:TRAP-type uncharacterized transport system fused permease subunit
VALAVFAAAGLAKANMWDSGWAAMRVAAAGYIVPFMFVYEPALLMINGWDEWHVSLFAFISATIGCMALAAGFHGYLLAACRMWERAVLIVAAVLLIVPEVYTSIVGIVLLGGIAAKQKFIDRPAVTAPTR